MVAYTTSEARKRQRELIAKVRAGEHPSVTHRGQPLMRWVSERDYHALMQSKEIVDSLADLGGLLSTGEVSSLRRLGSALRAIATASPGDAGRGARHVICP